MVEMLISKTNKVQWHAMRGSSMVKYTTLVPCIGSSESDLELYINFEICEGKNHKHFKNTLIYKAKKFMLTNYFQESLHIGASGVQEMILNK